MKPSELLSLPRLSIIGTLDDKQVTEFDKQLRVLLEKKPAAALVSITSTGGNVEYGRALYGMIRLWAPILKLKVLGISVVQSAALMPFLAVPKKDRYITADTSVVLHEYYMRKDYPSLSIPLSAQALLLDEFRENHAGIMRAYQWTSELIAAETGHTAEEIQELAKPGLTLFGKEIVDFGLADKIV